VAKIKLLPIYPSVPFGDTLEAVKAAKDSLDLDYLVKPVKAVSGSPGRVLAIGEKPDFVCDYAFVPNPTVESLINALNWVLGDHDDPRARTVVQVLEDYFGKGVKEIGPASNS
jgi:hypothetical protein